MILSVSRRTDIPAFYSEWFYNRVKEGFVYVRNPINTTQISKVPIHSDVVDCIVFWTKNPEVMIRRLDEISHYNYYFQFTLNPYNQAIENSVPRKNSIFDTFKRLSDKIGPERVIWRYDPILVSNDVDIHYHKKYFELIASKLQGYFNQCIFSFLENYKKTERNINSINGRTLLNHEVVSVAKYLAEVARNNNFKIHTCAEKHDLTEFGIKNGRCIDHVLIESIIKKRLNVSKDKNQRKECGCVQSVDIGEYNTCNHYCVYCYANVNKQAVKNKIFQHDPKSPLLIGDVNQNDIVKDKKVTSLIEDRGLFI